MLPDAGRRRGLPGCYARFPMTKDPRFTTHPRTPEDHERELEAHLAREPGNETVMKSLAFARYTNQRYREAYELYAHLLGRSNDAAVAFYAGNTMFRLGSLRAAIGAWTKAMQYDTAGIYRDRASERIAMAKELLAKDSGKPDE